MKFKKLKLYSHHLLPSDMKKLAKIAAKKKMNQSEYLRQMIQKEVEAN